MLHAKLSNIHILQDTLPTYLNIHTYLKSIFVTYLLHLNDIFAICSHFIHTYGHTPERQLHAMYIHTYLQSFGKNNLMLHIHLKGNFCITNSYIYILKGNFMPYIPILRSIFVPYSTYMHTRKALGYLLYIPMYMVNNIFTPSRYKEIIMA